VRRCEDEARVLAVLDAGGPDIVYQPIVHLWGQSIVGYEALARFPDGTPDEYFRMARVAGLGHQLELAAIRRAGDVFRDAGLRGYLSVNASPGLVVARRLAEELTDLPGGVMVEISEAEIVTNYRPLAVATDALRRADIRLAIDDFGAGYASFRHLIHLLPNVLKIDRTLVSDLDRAGQSMRRSILAAFTHVAARNKMSLVAEGIETPEELAALRAVDVRYGQGYLLGRPTPVEALS
jgi:EAL domain-containing protein (putative c-di-GMP-specific phosphodiesterase class I)